MNLDVISHGTIFHTGGAQALASSTGAFPVHIGGTFDWSTALTNQGTNAKGTILVTAGSGTYTYTYGGQTTGAIAFNADAPTVEAALELLSTIGNGNIRIAGTAPNFTYELVEDLRRTARSTFSSTGATIAATQAGGAAQVLTLPGGITVRVGERYVPMGAVIYKDAGVNPPRLKMATDQTSLVNGRVWVKNTAAIESITANQFGDLYATGDFLLACVKVDGTGQPTLTALKTAVPTLRFKEST